MENSPDSVLKRAKNKIYLAAYITESYKRNFCYILSLNGLN